jgi:hypothetical protein
MTAPSSEVAAVAEEIRRYLASHPNAADSAAGVLNWWLMGQRSVQSAQVVGEAMQWLIEQGVVTRRILPDGQIVYSAQKPTKPGSYDSHR